MDSVRAYWPQLPGALVALFLLATVAGCGPRPQPLVRSDSPFVSPSPTPAPGGGPLTAIGHFRGQEAAQLEAIFARFARAGGSTVRYEAAEQLPGLLQERLERGEVPDILFLPVPNWLHELASVGAIAPLPPASAATVRAHFGPAWVELVEHEGIAYGVPISADAKSLLIYRPDAVGDDPTRLDSLAGLQALAAERAAAGRATFALPGQIGWTLSDVWEAVLIATAGSDSYDALRTHAIPWTAPEVVAASRAWVALMDDAWLMDGAAGAAELPLWPESFQQAIGEGEAAIWLGPDSVIPDSGLRAGTDFTLHPFPTGGTILGVGSVAVATNRRPETMALLHFLAQPETVTPWVAAGSLLSPNRDVPLARYPSEQARREAELLVGAESFRYDLSDQLPPELGGPFLWGKLREMLLAPDEVERILAEIETVATREQGSADGVTLAGEE